MTFAFSRDGAIPGHKLWRRLGANRTPTWSVLFVVVWAIIITIPAYFPNSAGYPVAFFAVTSVSVIGLYIAYTIPVYLRWRAGSSFEPGPWTLGNKYKWMNLIAIVWVAICVVVFSLPFTPAGVPWRTGFSLELGQLRAADRGRRDARRDDLVLRLGAQDVQGAGPDDRRSRRRRRCARRRAGGCLTR